MNRRCRVLPENILPNIHNRSTPKKGGNQIQTSQRVSYSKCNICGQFSQSVSCIDCYYLLCINCGIAHSKQHQEHNVTDIHEAHQKVTEQVKFLDERVSKIQETASQRTSITKHLINCPLFEEQLQNLTSIRKEVEQMVYQFFEQLSKQYILLWNNYIEVWGQNKTFSDRLSQIQQKFSSFLQNESFETPMILEQLYKEKLIQQSKHIIAQYEKREKLENEEKQEKQQIIYPPRLLLDLSCITKINVQLQQLIQLLDWKYESETQIYSIQGTNYQSLPLIPTCAKVMYLYDPQTTEYQVGEFQDLRHQQIPFYTKSIFLQDGTLFIIGGADEKCNPVRSLLQYRDGELTNLASLPKAKNPMTGLVIYEKYIFVIGGLRIENNQVQWTKSCEKYSIAENKWCSIESMMYSKPHQTIFRMNQKIYALGMQQYDFMNFESFDIITGKWSMIQLSSTSINPFSFGGGYLATQINDSKALLFGGKMWARKVIEDEKEIFYDEEVLKTIVLYDQTLNQFISLGDCMPGTGISYGEFTPLCLNDRIIHFESPISKQKKIHTWLQAINVIQISFANSILEAEVIQMMTPD